MSKRRGRGEGGVEQLPSGMWRAVHCRVVDGRRVRETSTHRTKSEALAWLASKRDTLPVRAGTFGEWLDTWLPLHKAAVQASTYRTNSHRAIKHIRPALGHLKLKDLTPIVVESWLVKFREAMGQGEAHRCGKVLRTCLSEAVKKGVIPVSPFAGGKVTLPAEPDSLVKALTREQLHRLIATAGEDGWLIRLWVDLGCRPGEMLGLQWGDFDGECVAVTRSHDPTENKLKGTKTKRSRRLLPVAASTAAELQKVRESRTPKASDPILPAPQGGHWNASNFARNRWRPWVKRAGLVGVGPYALRHTCATLLLQAGVSIKVVSERLGHEDITTTLRTYAHVMPWDQHRAAVVMDQILTEDAK